MNKRNQFKAKPVCLLTSARSGSNWLLSLLNTHPDVFAHDELFHRFHIGSPYFSKRKIGLLKRGLNILLRDLGPVSFLETLLSQTSHDYPEMRFVLFKLFWYHNKRIMRHVIADDRYRIIALVRRNKLEQYSSRKIAMKTGQWALLGRKSKQTRVDFNLAEFQRYLRQMKAGDANMVEMLRQREHFFLYYEEVAERIGELAEWLKLDIDSLLADGPKVLQKQNSTNVLERFSNPDTVRELLRQEHLTEFIC